LQKCKRTLARRLRISLQMRSLFTALRFLLETGTILAETTEKAAQAGRYFSARQDAACASSAVLV
jgi:hypothetical protein